MQLNQLLVERYRSVPIDDVNRCFADYLLFLDLGPYYTTLELRELLTATQVEVGTGKASLSAGLPP